MVTSLATGHAPYAEIWRRFLETDSVDPPVRPTRGRHHRAALIVRVNDASLFRRLDRIRQALSGLRFIHPIPDHGLHVPVLDLMPVASREPRPGEVGPAGLRALADRLGSALRRHAPFSVHVGQLNVWRDVVFAEVAPSCRVLALGHALRDELELDAETTPPVPTFPVARIVAPGAARSLAQALEWFRERPIGEIPMLSATVVTIDRRRPLAGTRRIAELRLGSR